MATSKDGVRVPLTQTVATMVVQLLHDEGLGEGDSLPATGELAERFGVSRTVVREALAELTGRGLIRRQQGRESVVAVPGSDHLMSLFRSQISTEAITYDQLQDLREVVEIGAARLAARHAGLADIAALSDRLHAMSAAAGDRAAMVADVEFHRAIAQIANPLFGLVLDGLSPLLISSRLAVWSSYLGHGGRSEEALERHVALRDRIAEQDEDGAAAAMEADLHDTRRTLDELS